MVQIPSTTSTAPVWLHVGTLLDGTSPTPRRDAHVVYNAREILFVGSDGATPPRELLRDNQTTPDVSALDATLLPGLIEAHAHLFLEGGELDAAKRAAYLRQSPAALLAAAQPRMEKLARLGIAGIRDAGDKDGVGLALSKLCKAVNSPGAPIHHPPRSRVVPPPQGGNYSAGAALTSAPSFEEGGPCASTVGGVCAFLPYLDSPGAAIHHAGRYGGFMADAIENYSSLRAVVEARIAAGADRIKLIPTGIINFKQGAVTSEPQMTTAEVAEIVSAARSFNRQTFAHASGDTGIDRVIDGGVDSIEHGFFIRDDQLAKLRDRRIAWVPTFAPVQAQLDHAEIMGWDHAVRDHLRRILDQHAEKLRRAHELGVLIIAGSDAGSYGVAHGIGFLRELELMERAGLPSLAVLNAATGVSAQRLGYRENIGRIAPGARSRFILMHHSPLTTVANLGRARHVIFDDDVFFTDETMDARGL